MLSNQPSNSVAFRRGNEFIPLTIKDFIYFGSTPDNTIQISENGVSPRHARLEKNDRGFLLRDMQSKSGTYLNEVSIIEAYLTENDSIRIGNTSLIFSLETAPNEIPIELRKSKNIKWQTELSRLPAYANSNHPVLLLGESGTGKELAARTLHKLSPRNHGPMISINCSAISENLIESELFGHAKGSFTGAIGERKGAFELARGGTLFLDEIGDLPIGLQPKLLRAIENGEIWPVGAEKCVKTNVRVISATHPDLNIKINSGQFRQDLFYRLNTLSFRLPSLKHRLEDFEDILFRFAKEMRARFSFAAIQKLKEYSWPGNIRQLRNIVARAAVQYPGQLIEVDHVTGLLLEENDPQPNLNSTAKSFINTGHNLIKEFEREMIVNRLTVNRGNQRRTALDLGIPKSTLHDRIYQYGINPDNFKK